MGRFRTLIESSDRRVAFPIATYPALALSGRSITEMVTRADVQSSAQLALQRELGTAVLLTCMDLSVEAEIFGSAVRYSDGEIPSVIGRIVQTPDEVANLPHPAPGQGRTEVYLDTVRRLREASEGRPVMAGMIGPLSLAGRLYGVGECLLATVTEPETVTALVERATEFLLAYARAFKAAGADGVIIAEPTAGLLSPDALATYSSVYLQRIIRDVEDATFEVVLHNCGARANHLESIAASGATLYHFGAPMDIVAALERLSDHAVVCGNLDPAAVFVQSDPHEIRTQTVELLDRTRRFQRFVPSSGCDIPSTISLSHLQAFMDAVRGAQR
jgi:uroporphyrinogen decarboxylase